MATVLPNLLTVDPVVSPVPSKVQTSILGQLLGLGGSALCPRRQITVPERDDEMDPERGVSRLQGLALRVLNGERFRVRDDELTQIQCEIMLAGIRVCPYFGENAGDNDFFKGTSSFHVKFRDTHRKELEDHLPFLAPALDAMMRPECNSFYLNVIFARPDGQSCHVDNFFTDYCGSFRPTDFVSVAYLSDGPEAGGDLVLYSTDCEERQATDMGALTEGDVLQRVAPCRGRVVDFDGHLFHAVDAFTPGSQPRISLVLEQCKLARRHFMRTPKCSIYCQATSKEIDLA